MLVSIIIPTKNRRDLLRETLASVTTQTYGDWEAIVVDDGSTDGTEEMISALASTENRIRFVRRERRPSGASTCRNIGVSAAKGEYIIFLDSDDLLAPSCLQRRMEIIEQNPEVDFATFLTQVFHSTPRDSPYLWNNFTQEDDMDRILRRDPPWQTSGPIWRKASLAKIGPWDERALGAQDWEFHIRAIAAHLKYLKISEIDSFWRMTRSTSITYSWKNKRRLCNRVHLFKRITTILRSQNLLTKRRQRLLAAEYYDHAFVLNPSRRMALKIWTVARHEKIIGSFEYAAVIASDLLFRVARRANEFVVARLIPEIRLTRRHFAALPPTRPQNSKIDSQS